MNEYMTLIVVLTLSIAAVSLLLMLFFVLITAYSDRNREKGFDKQEQERY